MTMYGMTVGAFISMFASTKEMNFMHLFFLYLVVERSFSMFA